MAIALPRDFNAQIRIIISTESGSSWKQTALYNRSFPVSFKDNERLPFVQLLLPSQLINIDKFYRRRRCHGNRFFSSVRLTVFRRFHLNRWSLWVSISTNFVEVSAAGGDSHDFLWSRMQKISNLSALNQCYSNSGSRPSARPWRFNYWVALDVRNLS